MGVMGKRMLPITPVFPSPEEFQMNRDFLG